MLERFETFTVLINRINRNIRKIKNHEMSDYNLRSAHISCLYYIYHNKGITSSELCEKNGFITIEHEENKKYKSPIVLTDKGEETGKNISEKINRIIAEAGGNLTGSERVLFYRILTSISNNLDSIVEHLS